MALVAVGTPRGPFRAVLVALIATMIAGSAAVLGVPAAAAGGLVSDDFFGGFDTDRWQEVDPAGDGSVSVVGAGTGDAGLAIGVPGGVSHDAWASDGSVRVLQDVQDADFEVVAKFDSVPAGAGTDQGLQVRAVGSWLRFSVYAKGDGQLVAFAARTNGTSSTKRMQRDVSAPGGQMWLRVARVGSRFTYDYSSDGEAWTTVGSLSHDMVAAQIGPYAGNAGGRNAVGHTARVDFVFDTAAPVSPEDGGLDGGGGPADTTSPSISGVTVTPTARSARVGWVTDEPTTGRVEFGPTADRGETAVVTDPATTHEVTLPDLSPDTTYHYRVVAADLAGNLSTTANATFTTSSASAAAGGLVSDDFFGGFDTDRWQVVDPAGDGSVVVVGAGTGDAGLAIGVPGGVSHDAWGSDGSVRVLQDMQDEDFEVVAKFDSVPAGAGADQGLQVREVGSWLRFSVYAKGDGRLIAFGARTNGTSSIKKMSQEVTALGGQMWLRVARVGSRFTYSYSADGEAWTTVGSLTHDMVVAQVGPYAGNAGGRNAVGHAARVDFVFDTAAPISPEDGGLGGGGDPGDTTSPSISGITVTPTARSARVGWVTDEPTTGRVEFGPTEAYGQTAEVTNPATTHEITLSDLSPDTTYHYRVVAADLAGNLSTTANATFTTSSASAADGPLIDLWHEGTLTIGANGMTQPWANVLGRVSDPDGILELSYRLDMGGPQLLNLGPDARRLHEEGDFNADIETSALRDGDNTVVLTATDTLGNSTVLSTTVRLVNSTPPSLPYTLGWSAGLPVQDQATVVDGAWQVANQELRTTQVGYDRTVALGDLSWRDYEVTVPVVVRSIGPDANTTSGAALIGLGLRWQGHNGTGSWQPAWKYFPVGAYAWCKFGRNGPRLEILGNENDPDVSVQADPPLFDFGAHYRMKARVETLTDGTTRFAYKMWPQSEPEPTGWALDVVDTGPATGSILLIAHHVDASFGTVTVTPLD